MSVNKSVRVALELFREHGGTLQTREALRLGIHPRTLYMMRDAGILQQLGRGLYRLAELPLPAEPDLLVVAYQLPTAVICLVSALAFYELTTQIPHTVDIAVSRGSRRPVMDYPPLRVFWFSGPAWTEGIETHAIEGANLRVYAPAKTIADCFKYRNKIGLDIALEALMRYRQQPEFSIDLLIRYAEICRVKHVMEPYIESLV